MPLKRTPPRDLQSSNYESDSSTKGSTDNVTSRNKRKREHGDYSEELKAFKAELLSLFTTKFGTLQLAINDIKEQNEDIRRSQDLISEKYDDIILKIENLEAEKKKNLDYIRSIESKLDNMEKHIRMACLEIKNIPKKIGETKEYLLNCVIDIGRVIDKRVQPSDIRDIFRTRNKNKDNTTIIVEFCSVWQKEHMLQCVKKFNKENKLNLSHLQLPGAPTPIYISENLTQKVKKIFFLARDFAKVNNFAYCWTARGKVYLRKAQGDNYIRLENEEDLMKLQRQK